MPATRSAITTPLAAGMALLLGLFSIFGTVACERVTVDPKEIDLATPYIPIFSPEGEKIGEHGPKAAPVRRPVFQVPRPTAPPEDDTPQGQTGRE